MLTEWIKSTTFIHRRHDWGEPAGGWIDGEGKQTGYFYWCNTSGCGAKKRVYL